MRLLLKLSSLLPLLLITLNLASQVEARKHIRKGNKLYAEEKYNGAEVSYQKSLEEGRDMFESNFNMGDALYRQNRFDEASVFYQKAIENTDEKRNRSGAYHNLGNSYLEEFKGKMDNPENLDKSIEAYKNALKINPSDFDTKHNLAYANSLKQQQQQQQQNKDQNEENKDQNKDKEDQNKNDQQQNQKDNDQNEQKEGQNKEEQEQAQDKQEEQAGKNEGQKGKEEQKPQKPKEGQLSKEEAEKILEALNQDETELQQKMIKQKTKGQKVTIEKDW